MGEQTPTPTWPPFLSEISTELEGFTVCWENHGNTISVMDTVILLMPMDEEPCASFFLKTKGYPEHYYWCLIRCG